VSKKFLECLPPSACLFSVLPRSSWNTRPIRETGIVSVRGSCSLLLRFVHTGHT
jgi:hypothetical protein